jgi:hypothetical protein
MESEISGFLDTEAAWDEIIDGRESLFTLFPDPRDYLSLDITLDYYTLFLPDLPWDLWSKVLVFLRGDSVLLEIFYPLYIYCSFSLESVEKQSPSKQTPPYETLNDLFLILSSWDFYLLSS